MPAPHRQIRTRRTVLVVVEGDTEFAFCRYLKAVGARGRNIQITIRNAHGGSPDRIVEFARRQIRWSAFDRVVIVFDDDKELSTKGEKAVRGIRAQVFRFQPCIEGFFLRLMGRPVPDDSSVCKRDFHRHGLDESSKLEHDAYASLFPEGRFGFLREDPQFADLWAVFTNTTP